MPTYDASTGEAIVRALAATDPVAEGMGRLYCVPCGEPWGAESEDLAAMPSLHRPDCPWRLAVEWVAENPPGYWECAGRDPVWVDEGPGTALDESH